MEGSSISNVNSDEESALVTPVQKQELLKYEFQSLNIDLPSSSDGDESFAASMNEGYESPISSWDSETETDIPSVINCHDMPEEPFEGINHPDMEELNQFVGVENTDDGFVWEMDNITYEELIKKFIEKEEELRVSNFKLQLSEQKIFMLSVKVDNREAQLHYAREELKLKEEELHKQKEHSEVEFFKLKSEIEKSENRLDNVQEELKLKEEELHKQKEHSEEEIFKLKSEIEKSEGQVRNVGEELKLKEKELHKQKEHSEEEIFKLKSEIEKTKNRLDNVKEELKLKEEELHKQKEHSEEEVFKLKSEIVKSENRLDNVQEASKLKEEELHKQKEHLQEEIFKLKSEIKKSMNRLDNVQEELKLKEEELHKQKEHSEEEIFKLRVEIEKSDNRLDNMQKESKVEMEKLQKHIAELDNLIPENKLRQHEAEKLKQGKLHATQQMALQDEINCLREELDQKREYTEISSKVLDNVVIIKRDEATANIDKLTPLLNFKKNVKDLKALIKETAVKYETTQNELKLEMEDLVKEVTRQNAVMLDKDEEKREAIRQLCNSLDYYQSAYREVKEINKIYRSRCERNVIAS